MTADEIDSRVLGLREQGNYAAAAELVIARLSELESSGETRAWLVAEARRRVETLQAILALPDAARRDYAAADRLGRDHRAAADRIRYDEAIDLAERQLAIRRARLGETHLEAAETLSMLAGYWRWRGDPARAVQSARESLTITRDRIEDDDPLLAVRMDAMAILMIDLARNEEAGSLALEALEMRRRMFGDDHPQIASSLFTQGKVAFYSQRFEEAVRLHSEALAMRLRWLPEESPEVAESLQALGKYAWRVTSEYAASEKYLRQALAIRRQILGESHPLVAETLSAMAEIARWQRDLPEAEDLLTRLIAARRAAFGDHPLLADSLEELALVHRFAGEPEKLPPLMREAIEIRRRTLGDENPDTIIGRLNLVLHEATYVDYEKGMADFDAIEADIAALPDGTDTTRLEGVLLVYRANAAYMTDRHPTAEALYLRILGKAEAGFWVATNQIVLGKIRAGMGDLESAELWLARAAASFDAAREKIEIGTKSATFLKSPYAQLAAIRLERGRFDEAWTASELARGRVLADLLVAAGTRDAGELEEAPFPLKRLQATLLPEVAIVGWLDTNVSRYRRASWAYVIRNSGPVQWVRLESDTGDLKALAKHLRAFRDGIRPGSSSALGLGTADFAREGARTLYEQRFAPLEPHLTGIEEIVAVPSWAMGGFPLDVLVDADDRFLAERFAIGYAPSATIYTWLRETRRTRVSGQKRAGLLIGDPPFRESQRKTGVASARSMRSALRGDSRALESLPRLRWSRHEVQSAASLFDESQILLGADASEVRLDKMIAEGRLANYDVIHIATHALIDNERPQRSGLILSQLDLPGPSEALLAAGGPDGIVTGAEILEEWQLDADLVTLSACETALGQSVYGEGVVGLAYPFLRAGARSLLASLWKVDDEATALLIGRFYENWLGAREAGGKRMSKGEALREAKSWLRGQTDDRGNRPFAHPYYWSAFVLIGEN